MSDAIPVEDGHNEANDNDKLDGIVEQMRGDMGQGNVLDIPDVLRQRLADAGITVSDAEFDALVARLK